MSSRFLSLLVSCSYLAVALAATLPVARHDAASKRQDPKDATVLILGGGVSGIIAAKTLTEKGITNYKIIEARDELGGRLHSEVFGEKDRQVTVEVGDAPYASRLALTDLHLRRLAQIGFKESGVVKAKVPRTPSGPSFGNTASRRERVLTTITSVSLKAGPPRCGSAANTL